MQCKIVKFLLNSEGKKIALIQKTNKTYHKLLSVKGNNVIERIKELNFILDQSPDLAKKITSAKLIADRRWSLVFSYYTTLDLPEENPELAFKKLDYLNKRYGLLSDNLKIIDLRVKNRMIIKLNVTDFKNEDSKFDDSTTI